MRLGGGLFFLRAFMPEAGMRCGSPAGRRTGLAGRAAGPGALAAVLAAVPAQQQQCLVLVWQSAFSKVLKSVPLHQL